MADDGTGGVDTGGALSGLLSAGMGAATGNPIAIASGVLGLGMSIFGGVKQSQAAQQMAAAKQQIAGLETQQDTVRRSAMELSAKRQQMEVLRNAQRARSLALSNATSQGAQLGSGLQGGYGQIAGAENWNTSGIKQNLGFGERMFDLNALINQQKQNIAGFESNSATAGGIAKIGSTLMSSFSPIKNLSGNLGSSGSTPTVSDGGSGFGAG